MVPCFLILFGCENDGAKEEESEGANSGESLKENEEESRPMPDEVLYVTLGTNNQVVAMDPEDGTVIKKIPAGTMPIKIIHDPNRSMLYVANRNSGTVTVISSETGEVIQSIAVGTQPQDILLNGELLYVADSYLNSIRIVDLKLFSLVGAIELAPTGFAERTEPLDCCNDPYGGADVIEGRSPFTLTSNDQYLYVGNLVTRDVAVLDTLKKEETTAWDGGINVRDIEFIAETKEIYLVAVGADDDPEKNIIVIDINSGELKKRISLEGRPLALAHNVQEHKIYVLTKEMGSLTEIDIETGKITRTLKVGSNPSSIALSSNGEKIYISDYDEAIIYVISHDTLTIETSFPSDTAPTSIIYVGDGQ